MPRQPRIVHLPDSVVEELTSHVRRVQAYSKKRDVPHQLVTGLVFGLLAYFSKRILRRRAQGIHWDRLADCLLVWIDTKRSYISTGRKRRKHTNTDEQVIRRIMGEVPNIVTGLLQHPSPYILKSESAWLAQELEEYGTFPKQDVKKRLHWIEKKLHRLYPKTSNPLLAYGLLGGLARVARCPRTNCERETKVPTRDTLETWAHSAGSGVRELTFHILAYYHGSTYSTVKYLLRSRSS
jgi:hypothetical protein